MLKKNLEDKYSKNDKETHSVNNHIDCLTSFEPSISHSKQNVFDCKTAVSRSLNFAVQQNESCLNI